MQTAHTCKSIHTLNWPLGEMRSIYPFCIFSLFWNHMISSYVLIYALVAEHIWSLKSNVQTNWKNRLNQNIKTQMMQPYFWVTTSYFVIISMLMYVSRYSQHIFLKIATWASAHIQHFVCAIAYIGYRSSVYGDRSMYDRYSLHV